MDKKEKSPLEKRSRRNKELRQAEIREKIKAGTCLGKLASVANEAENSEDITSNRLAALRLVADIQFKLLNKVLPDLKAVEHTGEGGGPLTVQIVRFADTDPE